MLNRREPTVSRPESGMLVFLYSPGRIEIQNPQKECQSSQSLCNQWRKSPIQKQMHSRKEEMILRLEAMIARYFPQDRSTTAEIPTQRSAKFLMRMFVTFLLLMEPASRKPNPAFIIIFIEQQKNLHHFQAQKVSKWPFTYTNNHMHVYVFSVFSGTCINMTRDPLTRRNSWFKLTFSVSTSVKIWLCKEYGKF